jgi:signal transduction histidine kinase
MPNRAERWLLELIADRARRALDPSIVLVILEEGSELQVAASSPERSVSPRFVPIEGSALGVLYRDGEPVSLEHPQGSQADWLGELGLDAGPALVQPLALEPHGGIMVALRRDGGFRQADSSALAALASSLTTHLMAERTAEVERLRYGARSREHERERWARELHDETVQGLGALRMQLANARDTGDPSKLNDAVEQALGGLEREVMGIRHLITELRPAALDELGLEAAIEALARRAQAVYGLEVETQIDLEAGGEQRRFDADLETTVYRIVQEALNNVSRHAKATHATVSVAVRDGAIVATVQDNGQGMPDARAVTAVAGGPNGQRNGRAAADSGAAGSDGAGSGVSADIPMGGYGLPGMRERAELVGGELALSSAPGEGTTLRLTVPLEGRLETPANA